MVPLRRRVWLCREGWYYVSVLAFIVGGAVLRNVNLLVVLTGMMMAPLVLNWRMVMASLRGIEVRRKLPPQATAGQPLTVELTVVNHRRWFSSWQLRLVDRLQRLPGTGEVRRSPFHVLKFAAWKRLLSHDPHVLRPDALVTQAVAGEATLASYRVTLHRRGRYAFGPLTVSTRYPLGLVRGHVKLRQVDELVVAPRLGRLTHRWAELTESQLVGDSQRHPQRGIAEGDFYGLRPWQSGDSQRWIHWRTTAKLNTPTVRQFERQQSRDVAIVLDPWLPDQPQEADLGRLELAVSLAATAVVDVCQRGFGRLSFAIAGSQPKVWIAPASPLLCDELLLSLALVAGERAPNLNAAIDELSQPLLGGCRLLALSPRPQLQVSLTGAESDGIDLSSMRWIDVGAPDLVSIFVLE